MNKTKKTLYFDTETTGVDPIKNSIFQFAAIVEFDDVVVDRIDIRFQPFAEAEIEDEALKKTGITLEDLESYQPYTEGFLQIQKFFDKHVDKYNKLDKFYPAGYNIAFDLDFLNATFKRNGQKWGIGSYFNWKKVDPFPLLHAMDWVGRISLENYKLETVCKHFKIPLENAHDGMADIEATRSLIKKLIK